MSTTKSTIPIQPIDFDMAERAVDSFATARAIPSLQFPRAEPVSSPEFTARLNIEIPGEVMKAMKDRAHADNVTIRAIVLRAMHAAGIPVPEHHLVPDGRRTVKTGSGREPR